MDSIPGGEDTDKVRCCLDSKGFPASRDSYGQKPFIAHQVSCFGGRTVSFFLLLGTNTGQGGGLSGQDTETQYKDVLSNVWPEHQNKPLELLIRKQSQETDTTGVTQQNLKEGQFSHKQCWDNWVPGQR